MGIFDWFLPRKEREERRNWAYSSRSTLSRGGNYDYDFGSSATITSCNSIDTNYSSSSSSCDSSSSGSSDGGGGGCGGGGGD